jgi:hypothetical protein
MILIMASVGFGALWIFALFGFFIIISIFKSKKLPMDESNRINHIRLVWFAVTRPELFVNSFDWLRHDELDNIKK